MTEQAETAAAPVAYHWIAAVQTAAGGIDTHDGAIDVIPGLHTYTGTYTAVMANLNEMHPRGFALLFFSLTPDQL